VYDFFIVRTLLFSLHQSLDLFFRKLLYRFLEFSEELNYRKGTFLFLDAPHRDHREFIALSTSKLFLFTAILDLFFFVKIMQEVKETMVLPKVTLRVLFNIDN
jgi:hypothetical protein